MVHACGCLSHGLISIQPNLPRQTNSSRTALYLLKVLNSSARCYVLRLRLRFAEFLLVHVRACVR